MGESGVTQSIFSVHSSILKDKLKYTWLGSQNYFSVQAPQPLLSTCGHNTTT